ncbi:MAG: hypothetical protein OEU26_36945 [Candidatus Tectomicrobia bacterium]|nr:hypothetical protein [Candidatus Tectomicrobia bacterium]
MAKGITQEYDAILDAARKLSPADQLRLAKELVSGDHLVTFWQDWQDQLAEQGQVASDAEIDASVSQVRAERQRGKR